MERQTFDVWKRKALAFVLMLVSVVAAGVIVPVLAKAASVEEMRIVRIGYIDYEGFILSNEDGTYSGYGAEYLDKIAEYTGWKYEFVYDTWDNQLKNLSEGKIDFICHAQKTAEREQNYLFSKYPIGAEASVLYVKKEDERYYYNDFENFNGMKIAILRNSFQNDEFLEYAKKKGFSVTFYEYESTEECFEALERGTVDGVAVGSLAQKKEYKAVCRFGSDPFYFMTGKQNEELLSELDDALGQITAPGSFFQSDLYHKFYGVETSDTNVVFTREEAEYIENAEPVTIAFLPNRAPFSELDIDGNIRGITVDIVKLLEERSGLEFEYVMLSEGEKSTDYLRENPDHLIAGVLSENPDFHTEDYILTDYFYTDDVALACRTGMEYNLDAGENEYKLAIPKSYVALKYYIEENYPQFTIVEGTSTKECLKRMQAGEIDFVAQNVKVIEPILSDPHFEGLTILPTFFMNENTGIVGASSDENRLLIGILDRCIATISDRELSQFTVDHTVANAYRLSWQDMLYKFRYPVVAITILLLLVLGLMAAFVILRKRSYRRLEEKNRQLADAVAQADSASLAKSQFLARMSHEIRTPMNAIVGLTTLADYHKEESDKVSEYLEKISVSSKILLNIINDVLDMSAIESNKIKIAENPFNIREILTSISTVYYTQCKQKGIRFEMNTAEVFDEELIGDSLRLNQILLNLISNAYKFTPSGGAVTVIVKETQRTTGKKYFSFIVEDTGEGMTEEMLARLFKPFEQEGTDTSQKHGGSGLGLSIAKNLVDLMEGSISCTSQKGEGTRFTVLLPFEVSQSGDILDMQCKSVRALIVDDEADAREYISVILSRIGMPYAVAANGADALEKLDYAKQMNNPYDICFIDWKMPDINGGEIIQHIRREFDKNTLVIVVSAYDTVEIQDSATEYGANAFLTKPVFQSTVFNLLMNMSGGKLVKQTAHEEYDFAGKKVLLAEDTDLNAEIAIDLLAMVNMQVDHAQNGKIAVEMFEQSAPGTYDAILMDIQMPVMDGYTAARMIRASAHIQSADIPIFAMTANAFTEDVSAALNAGMNGHIAKPIDTKILYETLRNAM